MFYHIVLMSFTSEANAAFFDKVEHYVRRVRAECDGLVTYAMAQNGASRSDGLTHGVVATFRSSQAHDAYQVSPAHVEMKTYMSPFISRIVVLDTEVAA
ncbi:hypothetical protein FHS82_002892 [Pseudochelatococcus lubricantis]|uniref:Stress-response A/B barrel domain-containing protein n=1 Tax=Pseudochelatococcus lubricantis TaxID=1538102 RepID=A0ABX0V277_9HYPH|nr:Dabb family protein [Pseudochelatococcus lubricantis]NIJ59037.1 hypothetical protein [Pseudochelatococcus lubricantis]